MIRELLTRFGRNNLGFLWIVVEPLIFCLAVIGLWMMLKSRYEHGVGLAPFVMTGYVPMLLIRHCMSRSVLCVSANAGLLYHRQVTVFTLFVARLALEFLGLTIAFVCVYGVLLIANLVEPPALIWPLIQGWLLLTLFSVSLGLILGALSEMAEFVERIVGVASYLIIPVSGAFFMLSWFPETIRARAALIPTVHGFELIRAGVFGEAVATYPNPTYLLACSMVMLFAGLVLLRIAQRFIEVD